MKTHIKAEVIAHSRNPWGDEVITYELTFPRIILAKLNTHRMFTASSRAIPFKKMVEAVNELLPTKDSTNNTLRDTINKLLTHI